MSEKNDAAEASQWENLQQKSGKRREQWIALANAAGLARHGELVAWLKATHGIGHGYANLVATRAREHAAGGAPSDDALVVAMFSGKKSALRPRYERLLALIAGLGSDVEFSTKKSYVSVRRHKQFALVQPSTASRLDIGLNLKGVVPAGRLEAAGSFNAMCTHRIRIESDDDLDNEVIGWLRRAYAVA